MKAAVFLTALIGWFYLVHGLHARLPDNGFDDCNYLYYQQDYKAAIDCYQESGGSMISAAQFYNIGNAYKQMGRIGHGVLYYLRALYLNPADPDILANLSTLREEYGLFPPEPHLAERLANRLSLSQWLLLGLFSLVLYLGLCVLSFCSRVNAVTEYMVSASCLLILAVAIWATGFRHQQWQRSVVIEDTVLLQSPFAAAPSLGAIREGRLITPGRTYGVYTYVTDETGKTGWLEQSAAVPIMIGPQTPSGE